MCAITTQRGPFLIEEMCFSCSNQHHIVCRHSAEIQKAGNCGHSHLCDHGPVAAALCTLVPVLHIPGSLVPRCLTEQWQKGTYRKRHRRGRYSLALVLNSSQAEDSPVNLHIPTPAPGMRKLLVSLLLGCWEKALTAMCQEETWASVSSRVPVGNPG